ncbi:unnamed protein product [Cyprideis torosa]|uniref:Uncharacterized protein n=1 Tax=Cyprideis torosa TaxID=163714 RepID=A0A7R8WC82_9CRUS|nr:unnamed protein product [Cyprideis torosa]CAG0888176.1 unnamed protein product [Cyprideis torosa]
MNYAAGYRDSDLHQDPPRPLTAVVNMLDIPGTRFADRTDFIAKQVQEQGDIFNFTGFNNISGYPIPIVPNIIHFIRFNQPSLTLMEFICLRSALVRNADATVLIHSNTPMTGVHWKELIQDFGNSSSHPPRLQFVQKEIPQEIFNRKLTWIQHKSDVARLQILEKFGGIYLDNDVYVVHSLQPYLHFEFSIGWPSIGDQLLGNQILIGHKNSRFLQKYIATYKDYRGHLWYYNGGDLPTKAILIPFHELVHRVELKFGVFASVWPYWHQYDTIHLLQNHREFTLDYMNNSDSSALRGDFSLKDLATSPYAFAEMSRDVWPVLRNRVPGSV